MSHATFAFPGQAVTHRTDLFRIGPVVALVVMAHALLLAVPRQPAAPTGASAPARASVHVRMLEAPAPTPLASRTTLAAVEAAPAKALPLDIAPAAALPVVEAIEAAPSIAVPVLPQADNWLGLAVPGMASDDDLYFPRSQLAVVPAAIDPVVIDYPRFNGDVGRYVAELSLFIDETGRVARVRVDSGSLPAALEDAARRAFTQARFRPGEAAEHGVVKSRIRIEVTFDSSNAPTSGG